MTTITSACGTVETVTVRRTESCDAQQIHDLINPSTVAVFGRVNVIHLLERANLAVTLANAENEVLAHAAFFDCPVGGVVDQAHWEPFLHSNFSTEKCTTLNTLFLHLFVAQSSFASASVKEIVRAVFNVITELQYICLVSPNISPLEPALDEVFEPMKCHGDPGPQCLAFICHRHAHCPVLHVRRARVEDHDDLTHIFTEQSKELSASWGPFYLAELIQAQDHLNQAAVCESGGIAVGFIGVSGDVDLELLNESFELAMFGGLHKQQQQQQQPQQDLSEKAPQGHRSDGGICTDTQVSAPQDPADKVSDKEEEPTEESLMRGDASEHTPQSDQSEEAGHHRQHTTEQEAERVELFSEEVLVSPPSEAGDGVHVSSETDERENTHAAVRGASGGSGSPEQPDAFCIRLFVIDKNYEMRSVDFLPYIFTLFPDRDYCVITLSPLAQEFPLIQNFVRVAPRPSSTLAHELYVLHRSALLRCVAVRPALSADRPAVSAMVERLSVHKALLEDLDVFWHARRDPDGTPVQAFVAEVQSQIVGVLIIRNEEDMEYIRSHYNVENFIYFSQHRYEDHARLCHFVLLPVFQRHAKHFLKEALRLAHKTCLYYRVYPPRHKQSSCVHPVACVLSGMVPVRPRRQISYPLEDLGANAPSSQVTQEQAPYALNLLSRKLSMEPKVTINARLVVVGASDTALSFLETLVFCPHLWFNNVTLISTHGYPGNHHHNSDDISFLSTSHGYSSRDCVHLGCVVSVLTGTMVAIDREAKHIRVSGDRVVPYDHLILCTGLQYQVPCPTGVDLNRPITNGELLARPQRRYAGHVPSNLFTLNDHQDCSALHLWLSSSFMELEDNAIVYGNGLDVYTCVEALLGLGIRGSRIHLVLLPPSPATGTENSATCFFADPEVEKAVARALEKAGVHVHPGCLLALMNGGEDVPEPLASVTFTTDTQPLHLTCGVFINLSSSGVDLDAFRSISDACLVFDGRLVIDARFHTNDGSVHAAGPLTKFSRRYRADGTTHSCFSSGEVGRELAATLLALFDPTVEPGTLDPPPPDSDRLVPVYTQPRIQGGRLPGGYNYLHITKPSVPDPTVGPSFIQHSADLVTGRVETGNYFRLRLSRYDAVEGVTCLSLKPLPVSNYLCLYGKHQRLLNQLSSRYDQGLVHDLYSFFRETWCMALYHDRFADFEQEIKQIVESAKAQGRGGGGGAGSMTTLDVEENPKLFLQLFGRSGGLAALRSSTLNYLQYNRNHLPMYGLPGML